jgi:hypothetical protein
VRLSSLPGILDRVGADVLGDATGLTRNDIRLADDVEERGLAVVHVTHDGDHRGTGLECLGLVLAVEFELLLLGNIDRVSRLVALLGLEPNAVLGANLHRGLGVDGLGHRREDPHLHEITDDLEGLLAHLLSQFTHHDGRTHDNDGSVGGELGTGRSGHGTGTGTGGDTGTSAHLTRTTELTRALELSRAVALIRSPRIRGTLVGGATGAPLLRRGRTTSIIPGGWGGRAGRRRRGADTTGRAPPIPELTQIDTADQLTRLDRGWSRRWSRRWGRPCRRGRDRSRRRSGTLGRRNLSSNGSGERNRGRGRRL